MGFHNDVMDPLSIGEHEENDTARSWTNCTLASYEALREIVDKGQYKAFVWPDEGRFTRTGRWVFNGKHKKFQPLLIDRTSAKVMLAVYDALSEQRNRDKFVDWVRRGRGTFGAMVEFAYKKVSISFGAPGR